MAVPHFFQSSEATCGPTCLRMLFAAMGATHDEATIAQHCGTTASGCTLQDLVTGAQAFGLNANLLHCPSEADAVAALSQNVPFVTMIDLAGLSGGPMFQWHFIVALELTGNEVVFHDPAGGPHCRAKVDDILSAWAFGGYLGVRVWNP